VRFWDTSAIVPLLIPEARTPAVDAVFGADRVLAVWWATEVECASAIARLERDDALDESGVSHAFDRLRHLARGWHEVDPSDSVREAAVRFLRVHPLRSTDAQQLAAAFIAAERRPSSLALVTLDNRLAAAARKEGFVLTDLSAG
jgi:predicted nucleic acid-binding protein